MPNKNLSDDMLKLISYSIVCIERGRERTLLCNHCKLIWDNMTDCDFTTWVIADYCQHHKVPCDRKYLRVTYQVLDRWERQSLSFESKQLRRLEGIRRAILASSDNLPVERAPAERAAVEATGEATRDDERQQTVEVEKVVEAAAEAEEKVVEEAAQDEATTAEATAEEGAAKSAEMEAEEEAAAEAEPTAEDDLTKIKGVGAKISELLKAAGLINFDQLAATEVNRLEEILDAAGPRYRIADPSGWPEQAAELAKENR